MGWPASEQMINNQPQVTRRFNAFMEEHPDGRLDRGSFRKMMDQAVPNRNIANVGPRVDHTNLL